eukprot:RCo011328
MALFFENMACYSTFREVPPFPQGVSMAPSRTNYASPSSALSWPPSLLDNSLPMYHYKAADTLENPQQLVLLPAQPQRFEKSLHSGADFHNRLEGPVADRRRPPAPPQKEHRPSRVEKDRDSRPLRSGDVVARILTPVLTCGRMWLF